jgi:hypothetical protein
MVALVVAGTMLAIAVSAALSGPDPVRESIVPFAEASPAMQFGLDAGSIDRQASMGLLPEYAVLWAGPWQAQHGWAGFDRAMARAADHGVTPAIHLYYWGDDLSQKCLRDGCWSEAHNTWKDQAGWQALTDDLMAHLVTVMDGRPVLVIVETEFNKGGVATHEPLDQLLADKIVHMRAAYPRLEVVLGLGNWNRAAWVTWDRAAAAADYVGVQGLRAFTRHDAAAYYTLVDETVAGAAAARELFQKPIVLTDIGLSSYPHEDHEEDQALALAGFFDRLGALVDAGVEVFLYRSLTDNPHYSTREYFGHAEGAWGLVHADGQAKPSVDVWRDGVARATG